MNPPDPRPNLPTWLFILTDLALIGAAAVIAYRSALPLSNSAMLGIVGCVSLGAIIGLVPLVARFERQKNAAIDERQRALEALAQTVSASADQISIATGSLHEIADATQKNLRHAEHLPHKLQEKIAEFQAQLAAADDAEKEELEKELIALRTTESERLEALSTKMAKSVAEWAKLEHTAAQHLTAVTEAMAKLPIQAAGAITKAQAAADHAHAESRAATVRTLAEAEGNATRAIAAAQAAGLAALAARLSELDARLAAVTTTSVDRVAAELRGALAAATHALDEKIDRIERLAGSLRSPAPGDVATPAPAATPSGENPPPLASAAVETPEAETVAPVASAAEPAPGPGKRPRRSRREETSPVELAAVPAATPPEAVATEIPSQPASEIEPAPIPAETIAEVTPITPDTAEPFLEQAVDPSPEPTGIADAPAAPEVPATPEEATGAELSRPPVTARKRAARKPEPVPEPSLDLELDDPAPPMMSGEIERTLTSDGATRLLATAYIGIGNRLFIRGDGPGLSWEKGVPLQFVSIGKWRWETNDASAPIRFKLLKNDDQECTNLGEQVLEPGHLQEMTAGF